MPTAQPTSEDHAIRRLDAQWGDAASRYDLEAVVALYAPHGSLLWPGAEAVHGTGGIRTAWTTQMFNQFQGLKLEFTPERIDFSQADDLAIDFGKVALSYDDPKKGRVNEVAKYLVVWKKIDGAWKVLYDSYNANAG